MSPVLHSSALTHTHTSWYIQTVQFHQLVRGWLIDYYPEGLALLMSETGQVPRTTGGQREDWCLSLSHPPHVFFFLFLPPTCHFYWEPRTPQHTHTCWPPLITAEVFIALGMNVVLDDTGKWFKSLSVLLRIYHFNAFICWIYSG